MRARLVVGNWKMNGGLAANAALLDTLVTGWKPRDAQRSLAVCVPFPYLAQARDHLAPTPIAWRSSPELLRSGHRRTASRCSEVCANVPPAARA